MSLTLHHQFQFKDSMKLEALRGIWVSKSLGYILIGYKILKAKLLCSRAPSHVSKVPGAQSLKIYGNYHAFFCSSTISWQHDKLQGPRDSFPLFRASNSCIALQHTPIFVFSIPFADLKRLASIDLSYPTKEAKSNDNWINFHSIKAQSNVL